ncbi:MAG TPA: hypothetical protein VKE27_01150, partial [Candidatus Dormibacteraeota bacterium]|nr:hypothetical protein [Candidatus Dormibacteraeota bacterium]
MHDVLVNYLEVNFPEIADQLAHARGRDPGPSQHAAAAERLRGLIRRLRREAGQSPRAEQHTPRTTASELIAGVNGELSVEERHVLDHFFDLFASSMERTEAAAIRESTPESKTTEPPPPLEEAAQLEEAAVVAVAEPLTAPLA